MNNLSLLLLALLLLAACSHQVRPQHNSRVPQSESGNDCKKIVEYQNKGSIRYIEQFTFVQKEQLKVLGTYGHKLKTEIAILINGIQYETTRSANPTTIKMYREFLSELVGKSAYVTALYKQLKNTNIAESCKAFSYQEIHLDEESFKETLKNAQLLGKEKGIIYEVSLDFIKGVAKDAVKVLLKEAAYEIRDNVIKYIAWNGIKAIARESASGLAKGVLISAGTGTLINLLAKPLKGQTIPLYYKWEQLISSSLELYLNPEWMKKAGISTYSPWQEHYFALRNDPKRMQELATRLYESASNSFYSRISYIYLYEHYEENEAIRNRYPIQPAESTGVYRNPLPEEKLPYWFKNK